MKLLFYILLGYLIYRMLRGRFGRGPGGGQRGPAHDTGSGAAARHATRGEEMVQDPVCSSYVPMGDALKVRTRHGVVYFCGPECRDKFIADKDR